MLHESYLRDKQRKLIAIAAALVITLICAYLFILPGDRQMSFWQPLIAVQKLFGGTINDGTDAPLNKIILLLRLPRIILAVFAGIGLSVSGAVMQSLTRNYLVSPFTLGISASAAFGASVCIVFSPTFALSSDTAIIACAFLASCGCGLIVYMISQRIGAKAGTIVLVGIALNYLFSAMTATIEFFAQENKLAAVVQWTFGSFNRATWGSVVTTGLVVSIGCAAIMFYALRLNALSNNSDETAQSLGVNPEKVRLVNGLIAVLITSTIVSFTGVIGFVGLVAPHIARIIIGNDHRYYLPFAGIIGGFLLLVSDTIGKFIIYPVNVPVGIVISLLGAPLFVHLILAKRRNL